MYNPSPVVAIRGLSIDRMILSSLLDAGLTRSGLHPSSADLAQGVAAGVEFVDEFYTLDEFIVEKSSPGTRGADGFD